MSTSKLGTGSVRRRRIIFAILERTLVPPHVRYMRRVKLFIAWSLDGYIAREDGSVEWLFDDQDYGMTQFLSTIDTVVMSRKTYEVMEKFGQTYEGKRNIVFSRSRPKGPDPHVEWILEDAAEFISRLRTEDGGDIWVVGGGDLFMHLLKHEQIDDVLLAIHPLFLGAGIKLFPRKASSVELDLKKVKTYETGLLTVHYEVRK